MGPRTLCITEQGDVETKVRERIEDGHSNVSKGTNSTQLIEMWRVDKLVAAFRAFKSEELRENARHLERERQLQLVREEKLKLMANAAATAATRPPPYLPHASRQLAPPIRQNLIDIVLLSDPGPTRRINAKDIFMCKPADAFKVYRDSKFKFVDEDEAEREILYGRRTPKVIAQKLKLPQDRNHFKVLQGKQQILPASNAPPPTAGPPPVPAPHHVRPLVAIAPKPIAVAVPAPAPTIVAVTGGGGGDGNVPPLSLQQQRHLQLLRPQQVGNAPTVRAIGPGGAAGMSVLRASFNSPAAARMQSQAAATSGRYFRQQQHLIDYRTMYNDIQKKYFESLESIRVLTNENRSLKSSVPTPLSEAERVNALARGKLKQSLTLLKQIESGLDDDSKRPLINDYLARAMSSVEEILENLGDTARIKSSLKRTRDQHLQSASMKSEGTAAGNNAGSQLAKKFRAEPCNPCMSKTLGYVRAFLARADQVRLGKAPEDDHEFHDQLLATT